MVDYFIIYKKEKFLCQTFPLFKSIYFKICFFILFILNDLLIFFANFFNLRMENLDLRLCVHYSLGIIDSLLQILIQNISAQFVNLSLCNILFGKFINFEKKFLLNSSLCFVDFFKICIPPEKRLPSKYKYLISSFKLHLNH